MVGHQQRPALRRDVFQALPGDPKPETVGGLRDRPNQHPGACGATPPVDPTAPTLVPGRLSSRCNLEWGRRRLRPVLTHRDEVSGDDDAPTAMVLVADLVELERCSGPCAGGRPEDAVPGPHHHSTVLDREVDRSHGGCPLTGHREAAHAAESKQTHAFLAGQDRETTTVHRIGGHQAASVTRKTGRPAKDAAVNSSNATFICPPPGLDTAQPPRIPRGDRRGEGSAVRP